MKRNILLTVILGILCGFIFTKVSPENNDELIHLKTNYTASSMEDLTNNSSVIVEATVNNKQKEIEYSGVTFTLSEIHINNTLKGDYLNQNDVILLLQTKSYEDPVVEKGAKKILFLNKYEGAIVENAYVCVGLYQGNYTINEDNTISDSTKYHNIVSNEFINKTKDEVEKMIRKFNRH